MDTIFLHVGYPKTGTTSLQFNLFGEHSQIFDFRSHVTEMNDVREAICRNSSFQTASVKPLLEDALRRAPEDVGVYSEETFTSNLENTASDGIDRSTVANRLCEVFAFEDVSTEVILVIREQRSFLLSAFTFWYHTYSSMGYEDIDEMVYAGLKGDDVAFHILSWICYFDTIDAYRQAFGRENVHILLYEELSRDPASFVRRLSRIMGIRADESAQLFSTSTGRNVTKTNRGRRAPSQVYHWLSVLKSRYLPKVGSVRSFALGEWIVDWLRGEDGPEISLSEPSVSRLCTIYGEDNQKVETEFGLPLGENGYLLP